MSARLASLLFVTLASLSPLAGAQRLTSDFEIATAEKSLAAARTHRDRVAAHLNLGDLRASRMEIARAREHYERAESAAHAAAADARRTSDLAGYALFTAYRGIAYSKLGMAEDAVGMFEESLRYESDSATVWNHYASGLLVLGFPQKGAAAARNAVLLAEEESATEPDAASLLDLAIYRYALAGALLEIDPSSAEAERILSSITDVLASRHLDPVRRQITRDEGFEVFSFVRGDAAAYLSLYNRSLLRLAAVRESNRDSAGARAAYARVLELRSDDPTALAGLARLSGLEEERDRLFAESFAANPFSASTIVDYERWAAKASSEAPPASSPLQRAVWLIARDRAVEARPLVAGLTEAHRGNAAIAYLEARIALAGGDAAGATAIARTLPDRFRDAVGEAIRGSRANRAAAERMLAALGEDGPIVADRELLESILAAFGQQGDNALRARLDSVAFTSIAIMDAPASRADGITVFNSGTIGGIPFRFSIPTAFRGDFAGEELRIHYRVTGADEETLLVEPLGIERQ
jgi:tetratricopeptide (TPR) repeat protein